jgi:hypothetical protein
VAGLRTAGLPAAYHRRMDDEQAPSHAPRRPPVGVLIIVALRVLDAISLAGIALGLRALPLGGLIVPGPDAILVRSLDMLVAVLGIVGAVGLVTLQRWGWTLTMILVGIELAAKLIRYSNGQPDPLGLLLLVVTAFYLNQSSVRALAGDYLDDASRSR